MALLLSVCMLTGVTGCGNSKTGIEDAKAEVEMQNTEPTAEPTVTEEPAPTKKAEQEETIVPVVEVTEPSSEYPLTDFSVDLFQTVVKQEGKSSNVLVSPLSVMMALGMTANGAAGETKTQMEEVLGKHLNVYLSGCRLNLPNSEKCKLHLANGIWFKDNEAMNVKESFLQVNEEYYDAEIHKAPFNDATLNEINQWVKEHTDGMIENILDRISKDAVMYLVNALGFQAEWSTTYSEHQVMEGTFTKEDGTEQKADMMYSSESVYLEDALATGFMKYYSGKECAFVALLPKEGVTVAEYVESLTGEHLAELLNNPSRETVQTAVPKFETEYSVIMNEVLAQMGMIDAFHPIDADFSAMAEIPDDWNLYISRVLHKTFISLDEKGTKAGAATVVEMMKFTSAFPVEPPKQVYLDRPFVYLLINCESNEPFFMGTMMDVEQ